MQRHLEEETSIAKRFKKPNQPRQPDNRAARKRRERAKTAHVGMDAPLRGAPVPGTKKQKIHAR